MIVKKCPLNQKECYNVECSWWNIESDECVMLVFVQISNILDFIAETKKK